MTRDEIHARLQRAFDDLLGIYGHLPEGIKADTVFAIGEATGCILKAKALVAREIDDASTPKDPHAP